MGTVIRSYRDLILWQRAMDFTTGVYRLTECFPRHEQFGLRSQLRRSAVSVPSNIAEGHARQGQKFAHFLSIARGSLAEAETQLLLAVCVGYLNSNDLEPLFQLTEEIKRMSAALTKKLKPPTSTP